MTEPSPARASSLDHAVYAACAALESQGVPAPAALVLMATGVGLLPERLADGGALPLAEVAGVPDAWHGATLHFGKLGGLCAWWLADTSSDPLQTGAGAPWTAVFPTWLAAAAGAQICLHTSAASALSRTGSGGGPAVGTFGLVRDHINLSGATPLLGLGESALGPLFPDLSELHHSGLRMAAHARAKELGLATADVVAACTAGPSIETPAERRWLARAGADVCVQGLSAPLLACGHAGLFVLAITIVADSGDAPTRLRDVVAASRAAEPALEDLLVSLGDDVAQAASSLADEGA